jgi:hypothetical protein
MSHTDSECQRLVLRPIEVKNIAKPLGGTLVVDQPALLMAARQLFSRTSKAAFAAGSVGGFTSCATARSKCHRGRGRGARYAPALTIS